MDSAKTAVLPPLRGDASGNYRILLVGNSGVGKSTLGRELAAVLKLPLIQLDVLHWGPGWAACPRDEFKAKVRAALDENPRGWVVDGQYMQKIGNTVYDEATDVIWLDPPLLLYFPRLCWRTFARLVGLAPPCSPGCEEDLREVFFSSDSIVWWCLTHHWTVRKRFSEPLRVDGVAAGGKLRRIGGWGAELAAWMRDVRAMVLRAGQDAALPLADADIAQG